ncbi:hypothetical protein ACLOJK_023419 [Asimina triloba]
MNGVCWPNLHGGRYLLLIMSVDFRKPVGVEAVDITDPADLLSGMGFCFEDLDTSRCSTTVQTNADGDDEQTQGGRRMKLPPPSIWNKTKPDFEGCLAGRSAGSNGFSRCHRRWSERRPRSCHRLLDLAPRSSMVGVADNLLGGDRPPYEVLRRPCSRLIVIREPGDLGRATRVSPSEDRPYEEPDRIEASGVEQSIPMEEVPEVNRGEVDSSRDVPQVLAVPGGGDNVVMTATLTQMMQAQQESMQAQQRVIMEFI